MVSSGAARWLGSTVTGVEQEWDLRILRGVSITEQRNGIILLWCVHVAAFEALQAILIPSFGKSTETLTKSSGLAPLPASSVFLMQSRIAAGWGVVQLTLQRGRRTCSARKQVLLSLKE